MPHGHICAAGMLRRMLQARTLRGCVKLLLHATSCSCNNRFFLFDMLCSAQKQCANANRFPTQEREKLANLHKRRSARLTKS